MERLKTVAGRFRTVTLPALCPPETPIGGSTYMKSTRPYEGFNSELFSYENGI